MSSLPTTDLSQLPAKQTAVVQDDEGKPTLIHDASVPDLQPGTLLVKTVAVALNPSDYKMGLAFTSPGAVIGGDFAGHIIAIDPEAQALRPDLRVGDAVCGMVHGSNPGDHQGGSFAEYVRVLAHLVLKVPADMSLADASTLGCALLTSSMAIWDVLQITATPESVAKEPVPVLVYGGSTSSGTMAVQLLRLWVYLSFITAVFDLAFDGTDMYTDPVLTRLLPVHHKTLTWSSRLAPALCMTMPCQTLAAQSRQTQRAVSAMRLTASPISYRHNAAMRPSEGWLGVMHRWRCYSPSGRRVT